MGLEHEDAQTYSDWGVDYLKYDNCYTDHGSPQSRYYEMATALQSVTAAQVLCLLSVQYLSQKALCCTSFRDRIRYSTRYVSGAEKILPRGRQRSVGTLGGSVRTYGIAGRR